MRILFSKFIFLLILSSVLPAKGQDFVVNSSITGVCYAGNKTNRIYIPPPDEFYKKGGSKGGGSIRIYYSGFPNQAITAMEYAASILEALLPADTKMTVLARWIKIADEGLLGNSSITGYAGGWAIDALNPLAYYPVALAEKIAGVSLNDDTQGDIELNINSSINWYLGIDGNTPPLAYDLVTVILHEICHGLGFFDSMNADGVNGWYGIPTTLVNNDTVPVINDTLPMIYDTFIENLTGDLLTDKSKFSNYSSSLRVELTGNQLYFNGPLLKNYTTVNNYPRLTTRAKLHAPSIWDPGSSISHLDDDYTLVPDALMTPYIDKGEAIHDPGQYTFSMLGDLGWINTRIIHQPMADTEDNLTEIVLSATIESDTLYNRDKVGVVYSFDNFLTNDTLFLYSPDSDDSFQTTLSIPSYNTEIQYYFFVEDCFLRLYNSPSFIDLFRYKVYIGADTMKPLIYHFPNEYYLETIDTIGFLAFAIDNIGIDTVYVEYKVNDGPSVFLGLNAGIYDSYSITFPKPEMLIGGDSIQYRIFAIDSALVPNTSVFPDTGYLVIDIEDIGDNVLIRYSTDFVNAKADFFNIGFEISKPSGFSRYGLHTKHPYESPDEDNLSINYISMLRHPIKFNGSGIVIAFNELVLVEPGESGSVYGSDGFYDYVILEASNNFGKTWFSLTDGYDCRFVSSWEKAYNSSGEGMNSTFIGTESMLRKHTVFYKPSSNISEGDTILLRFRLFSDPYAYGWGWVIEDLQINNLIDAVEEVGSEKIKIYPNPGSGLINISSDNEGSTFTNPIRYSIFNSAGICIINDNAPGEAEIVIDISSYPKGIYFIIFYLDDGIKTFKYILD